MRFFYQIQLSSFLILVGLVNSPALAADTPAEQIRKIFIEYYYTPEDGILREAANLSQKPSLFLEVIQQKILDAYKDAKAEKVEDVRRLIQFLESRIGRRDTQEIMLIKLNQFAALNDRTLRTRALLSDVAQGNALTNLLLQSQPEQFRGEPSWLLEAFGYKDPVGTIGQDLGRAAVNARNFKQKFRALAKEVEATIPIDPNLELEEHTIPNIVARHLSPNPGEEASTGELVLAPKREPPPLQQRNSLTYFVGRTEKLFSASLGAQPIGALPGTVDPNPVSPVAPLPILLPRDAPGKQDEAIALISHGVEPDFSRGAHMLNELTKLDWPTIQALERLATDPNSPPAVHFFCRNQLARHLPLTTQRLLERAMEARLERRDPLLAAGPLADCLKNLEEIDRLLGKEEN